MCWKRRWGWCQLQVFSIHINFFIICIVVAIISPLFSSCDSWWCCCDRVEGLHGGILCCHILLGSCLRPVRLGVVVVFFIPAVVLPSCCTAYIACVTQSASDSCLHISSVSIVFISKYVSVVNCIAFCSLFLDNGFEKRAGRSPLLPTVEAHPFVYNQTNWHQAVTTPIFKLVGD